MAAELLALQLVIAPIVVSLFPSRMISVRGSYSTGYALVSLVAWLASACLALANSSAQSYQPLGFQEISFAAGILRKLAASSQHLPLLASPFTLGIREGRRISALGECSRWHSSSSSLFTVGSRVALLVSGSVSVSLNPNTSIELMSNVRSYGIHLRQFVRLLSVYLAVIVIGSAIACALAFVSYDVLVF